jgi:purine/pyrimidine-nucleoside phosphorylase
MSEFHNVSIVKQANVYFDGNVTSRTVKFADGSVKTLGFMLPGEYTFGTDRPELMEILAGRLDVLLPGESEWCQVTGGQAFEVAGQASFRLKVLEPTDYCCSYL